MICKISLSILVIVGMSLVVHAVEKETVQIRAVLHDPARPVADLFYTDKNGTVVQLNFRPQDLTEPLFTLPVDSSLVLYDTTIVDTSREVRP